MIRHDVAVGHDRWQDNRELHATMPHCLRTGCLKLNYRTDRNYRLTDLDGNEVKSLSEQMKPADPAKGRPVSALF